MNSLIRLAILPTSVNATQTSLTLLITTLKATGSVLLLPDLLPHLVTEMMNTRSWADTGSSRYVLDSFSAFARSTKGHLNMPQNQDKIAGPYLA